MLYEWHTFSLWKSYEGRRPQKANASASHPMGITIPVNSGDPVQFFGAPVLQRCSSCWQRGRALGVCTSRGRASPGARGRRWRAVVGCRAIQLFVMEHKKTHSQQRFVNTGFRAAPVPLSRYLSLHCKRREDNWLPESKCIGTAGKNAWLWKLLCTGGWLRLREALLGSFTCGGSRGVSACPAQLVYHHVLH